MNTTKINSKGVKMVAHRGVSGLEKENTNAAFIAAGNRSYFGVETDVHLTADGKWVIMHDSDPKRVSGVSCVAEEVDLATLRQIRLNDIDGSHSRIDLVIPTLEEYINTCKRYEKKCVLEIKTGLSEKNVIKLAKTIEKLGYLDNVIMISFNLQNLLYYRKNYPDNPAQFLCGELTEELWQTIIENHLDIDIYFPYVTKELVERAHKAGLLVNCWTPDSKAEGEKLVDLGVDFITSNILE